MWGGVTCWIHFIIWEGLVLYLCIPTALRISICKPWGPFSFEWMNWWMSGGSSRWHWTPSVLVDEPLNFLRWARLRLTALVWWHVKHALWCLSCTAVMALSLGRSCWTVKVLEDNSVHRKLVTFQFQAASKGMVGMGEPLLVSADTSTQSHSSHQEYYMGTGTSHPSIPIMASLLEVV